MERKPPTHHFLKRRALAQAKRFEDELVASGVARNLAEAAIAVVPAKRGPYRWRVERKPGIAQGIASARG